MEQLETVKFGTVEYGPGDVLDVREGLPGFRDLRRFLIIDNPALEPIKFLQSIENPMISFPMIDPRVIRSDYVVELRKDDRDALALENSHSSLAYSIVTLGSQPEHSTANLFAPVVINTATMKATQIFLTQSDYSVTEPLLKTE